MNRTITLAILLSCGLCAGVHAQSGRGGIRGTTPGPNTGQLPGNPGRIGMPMPRPMDSEFPRALEYFTEHSPLRASAYENMSDEQKRAYNATIIDRYRTFQLAENEDLRKCLTRQLGIEDKVFDLKRRIDALAPDAPEYAQTRDDLREAVAELVETRLLERSLRIARMGQLLAEERSQLENDSTNKQQLIDQRFNEILRTNRADPSMSGRAGREPSGDQPGRGPRGRSGD